MPTPCSSLLVDIYTGCMTSAIDFLRPARRVLRHGRDRHQIPILAGPNPTPDALDDKGKRDTESDSGVFTTLVRALAVQGLLFLLEER
jgi:hypothetical protein